VFGVDVDLLTVGGHHVQAEHALARRPVDPAVPSVPALQQVPADTNALAVARREEQIEFVEFVGQHTAALAGPDHRHFVLTVDRGLLQAAHVEQDRAVAQMVGGPAVAAGLDADLLVVRRGVAHRGDDVVGVDRLHDHLGIAHPTPPGPRSVRRPHFPDNSYAFA